MSSLSNIIICTTVLTRNYCHHKTRCVKCGLDHYTDDCTKKLEEPSKCANCGENHTANYKIYLIKKIKKYYASLNIKAEQQKE